MRKRLKESGTPIDASRLYIEDMEGDDSEANEETIAKAPADITSK